MAWMEKRLWGLMPPFGDMKGRVGEDNVGEFVPALLGGEGVVFVDVWIGEAVEVAVHQGQSDHIGRDVVAFEVFGEAGLFVGGEWLAGKI